MTGYTVTQILNYPEVKVEHMLMSTGEIYKTETIGGQEMVKIQTSSSYMRAEDFEGQDELEGIFVDEGQIELAKDNKWGREAFKITVRYNDLRGETQERLVTLNNTSKQVLKLSYGDDSKNWVDKSWKARVENTLVKGKPTNVLYFRPANLIR